MSFPVHNRAVCSRSLVYGLTPFLVLKRPFPHRGIRFRHDNPPKHLSRAVHAGRCVSAAAVRCTEIVQITSSSAGTILDDPNCPLGVPYVARKASILIVLTTIEGKNTVKTIPRVPQVFSDVMWATPKNSKQNRNHRRNEELGFVNQDVMRSCLDHVCSCVGCDSRIEGGTRLGEFLFFSVALSRRNALSSSTRSQSMGPLGDSTKDRISPVLPLITSVVFVCRLHTEDDASSDFRIKDVSTALQSFLLSLSPFFLLGGSETIHDTRRIPLRSGPDCLSHAGKEAMDGDADMLDPDSTHLSIIFL